MMNRYSGCKTYPIWLIADSSPVRLEEVLREPLDPRHPTRHNIWTPILDGIQNRVFLATGRRINTANLYTRNAVHDARDKPPYRERDWPAVCEKEIAYLQVLIEQHNPRLLLTLGGFAFEFVRRTFREDPVRAASYWGAERLGIEFRRRVKEFAPFKTNPLPLLHASIARGRFLESHRYFTKDEEGNYFQYVAKELAILLLRHEKDFPIWH